MTLSVFTATFFLHLGLITFWHSEVGIIGGELGSKLTVANASSG